MKNYAKFCKLNIDNHNYVLNLTEGGLDDANIFNKTFAWGCWSAPFALIYFIGKNYYINNFSGAVDVDLISKIAAAGLVTLSACLPISNLGKGCNAIIRNMLLVRKTKKYYKKMRKLETKKREKNKEKISNKQIKISRKFVKKLTKITKHNEFLMRKYSRIEEKKGYVEGLKSFAYDNLLTIQESIDKFIFHNRNFLYNICPKYKGFIRERSNVRYNTILNDGSYYDEYIWSATHKDDNLVKNDCVRAFETSNYLQELKTLFNLQDVSDKENTQNSVQTYSEVYKKEQPEYKVQPIPSIYDAIEKENKNKEKIY